MARANYFEALWKVEKLTCAKLRATNRNLTQHIYGRSSEKLTDAHRVLFGLIGDGAPADLSEEGRQLMKERARASTTAAPMNLSAKVAGAAKTASKTFLRLSR
jgi:hypothetical protein